MAPDGEAAGDEEDVSGLMTCGDISAAKAELKARLSRKRTKTGCLTCRKRRIKCGEERPICRNCVKSKRHCEGYSQRVVFGPTYDYRPAPNGGAHITFQVPGPPGPFPGSFHQQFVEHPGQAHLRPRPTEQGHNGINHTFQQAEPPEHHQPPMYAAPNLALAGSSGAELQQPYSNLSNTVPAHLQQHPAAHPVMQNATASEYYLPTSLEARHVAGYQPTADHSPDAIADTQVYGHAIGQVGPAYADPLWQGTTVNHQTHSRASVRSATLVASPFIPDSSAPRSSSITPAYAPRPELCRPIDCQVPSTTVGSGYSEYNVQASSNMQCTMNYTPTDLYEYQGFPSDSPNQILHHAAVEVQDDDYYDVNTDEEMDVDTAVLMQTDYDRKRTFSGVLQHVSIQEAQMRRYDTFICPNMLDVYRVEEHANPLRNEATARVFMHFIAVTGPSLSIFERHPRNTSVLFTEGQIPFSQQGLWTYTMPMAAMRHQGLLHAMLALASLHIARLKGASATPSMQHYAWALKRVHHCVGHPKKRLKLTTIAASMLLGFYEIMTADHMKWNTHLSGSSRLFIETDFASMTRQFRQMKDQRAARQQVVWRRGSDSHMGFTVRDEILDQIPDVDERLISNLVGREVRYGDHGKVESPSSTIPRELDLSRFEILKDLYWWYCKQDVYQSIVSGNDLFMEFSRYANCPPRAPLGRADAVYGSFDHLILLLARTADFACRDRPRKLMQIELNGAASRLPQTDQALAPPQGSRTPQTTNGARHHDPPSNLSRAPPPASNGGPAFFGMAPPPRQNVHMPASYTSFGCTPTRQRAPPLAPVDLHAATEAAWKEYQHLHAALDKFANSLGAAFQPLRPDEQPTQDTPFGLALAYRSYDIGCLWAVYNMAIIIAIRSRPDMPPAAHVAAAYAAQETERYAHEIGRIAAGIVPGPPGVDLNPTLGAALCESCMPSFFAAIQYKDDAQRRATVARIFNIGDRTGWGSADLIANGCESAWVKAAAAGRGPPYTRVGRREESDDPRMNGSWEKLDMNSLPDGRDESDRRHLATRPDARLNWAFGIMGTEEDARLIG